MGNSKRPGIAGETMAAVTTAQWNQGPGGAAFIQNVKNVNNLESGEAGADSGPGRKWDFAAPNAGNWMVDSLLPPFFTVLEKQIALPNNVATTLVNDSPALPLSAGTGGIFVNSVLPAVGDTTNADVTYSFVIYATVAFDDKSIYCLGQQPWSVRYAGAVTQPVAGTYNYTKAAGNADTGSGAFTGVRNNANPAATGLTTAGPGLNGSSPGWR